MEVKERVSFKELFGWCMFDFANSSYTTVIISVIYCDVFSRLVVPAGTNPDNPYQEGNLLWGIALFISYMLVVVTGPILGAITDFSARKKKFLLGSFLGCISATALLWFVSEPGFGSIGLAFFLIVASNFFFASGENIASSFLPFLGPKDDLGKISGYAWGIGYFGGVASVAIVSGLGEITTENFQALRMVGPYTAAFFLIAGLPTFLFLKEYGAAVKKPPGKSYVRIGFDTVVRTLRDIAKFKDMQIYLLSLFFSMAALGVVISFAFIYGAQEIHIENKHRQAMFILIQISAALGAVAFGFLQDRMGAKKTFNVTLVIWIICLMAIHQVVNITSLLNSTLSVGISVQWMFVIITSLAGMGLGSTQSSSRAIVGMFAPESKSGEFFGLWGLSGKLAAALGIFSVSLLQTMFSLRNSFIAIAVFFIISLGINFFVDEERGIATARNYKD
ncbi:MAG TPA: MFS transporter [Leptospiraceae bacterium]|nr:MFS transporter [Leptospiraceae bacterium]HRG46896.1 MFS transporter [Leptospiraceae bacterium]HRG75348.1 MFS transporter [Leptospiraceae bacterium]